MAKLDSTTKNEKASAQGQAGLDARQAEFDLGKKKNSLLWLIPFIALQLVVILLLEGVLFACGLGEEETFKLDNDLGFVHMPSKRITWRSEGFAQSYFDANGMREPGATIAKPANTYRIAFLGDSLTESLQVPLNESFTYKLEQTLKKDVQKDIGNKNVQVLNFGVSGYATVQEYLLLKKKVLAFKPDLVILCYDTRDMFENWSPPDQVLTNVRPLAIKLDGQKLAVSSNSVTSWMNTPRARFLRQIEWIRQNSRIWGLISAWDLEMSMHNATYKAITNFITDPKKSFKDTFKASTDYVAQLQSKSSNALNPAASNTTASNTATSNTATSNTTTSDAPADKKVGLFQTSSNSDLRKAAVELEKKAQENSAKLELPSSADKEKSGSNRYGNLVAGTLEALFQEMDKECRSNSAKFAVVLMPARAALVKSSGMETSFFDIDFDQEIGMINKMCQQSNIPVFNTMVSAYKLPQDKRQQLFYTAHLTPEGHQFVASDLESFVKGLVSPTQEGTER